MLRLKGRKTLLMKENDEEVQNAPSLPTDVAISGKSPPAAPTIAKCAFTSRAPLLRIYVENIQIKVGPAARIECTCLQNALFQALYNPF
jgi:hypothetical protein